MAAYTLKFKHSFAESLAGILLQINQTGFYLSPEKFKDRVVSFAQSLAEMPERNPISDMDVLKEEEIRVSVMDNQYAFLYRVHYRKVEILNIIHISRLPV